MNIFKLSIQKSLFRAVFALAAVLTFALILCSFKKDPVLHGTDASPLVIDIQGDIDAPGVRLLPGPCAAVSDVLKAVGIPTEGKIPDEESLKTFSRTVCSGNSVHVSRSQADGLVVRIEPMSAEALLTLGKRLDINKATQEELCLVPLMKPEFACAIVERRRQRPWERLEDLEEISGIGPKTVERWKNHLKCEMMNTRY